MKILWQRAKVSFLRDVIFERPLTNHRQHSSKLDNSILMGKMKSIIDKFIADENKNSSLQKLINV